MEFHNISSFTNFFYSHSTEETLPKMMEIDKSTQRTLEDQMFYRRITLKELTGIRHDNPTDEVMNQNSSKT